MAPPVKDRQQLPDEAKPTADLISRLGFKWELDYEYPLPDLSRRVQIRDTRHYAPPAQVSQYAAAMRNGDKFAPIVVTRDGHLIDGNTRAEATAKNKRPDIRAFILNVDYESAPDPVRERLHILGAAFNTRNGRGIDRTEIIRAIRVVVGSGDYDATRVAALLGVTARLVQDVFAEERARERATKLHVALNGSVASSQIRELGYKSEKLNDEPWSELAQLTIDAGLSRQELTELCKRVLKLGTDKERLATIREERESREEQIAQYTATGKKKPPVSGELRRKLGYVLGYEDDPRALVEHNPDLASRHLEQISKAIEILQIARSAQRELLKAAA